MLFKQVLAVASAFTAAVAVPVQSTPFEAPDARVTFETPWYIADVMGPAYFFGLGDLGMRVVTSSFAGAMVSKNESSGTSTSDNQPWTRTQVPNAAGQVFPSQTPASVVGKKVQTVHTYGSFHPKLVGTEQATQVNATGGLDISLGANGELVVEPRNITSVFEALPKPIISAK